MEGEALSKASLTPFAPAFLAGDPRAEQFLPPDHARPAARIARAREAAGRAPSRALAGALRRQSARLPPSAAREAHLALLARPGTCAVVTGQQVGLFLGPLYTLYKAATAVAVARALEAEAQVPCVPVFWLQTEDHDFAEVDHCHCLDAEGALVRFGLAAGSGDAHAPVRDRLLGPELEAQLAALAAALGDAPCAGEVLSAVRAHYRPGATLAGAFAGLLAELFAEEGLVLLDPRDPELAAETAAIHRRAVEEAEAISLELSARQQALARAGFEAQVHVREGSPLSFFHPAGAAGPRYRLAPHPGGFSLVGRDEVVPRAALLQALEREPLAFSSSALLRPIVQDTLLPTAAVVGGPGELNYFAQLAPLYRRFGLPVPLVVPRARFRLVDPRTRRWLDQLGLEPGEVEVPREVLLARLAPGAGAGAGRPAALEAALVARLDEVLAQVEGPHPPDLAKALRRTRGTIARAASRLAGRWRRGLEGKDEVATARVDRLQQALFPHGEPQERVLGCLSFAARAGLQGLKRAVLAALTPYSAQVKDVRL